MEEMQKIAYVICIEEYVNKIIVDVFYLEDTVYPGRLVYFNKAEALKEAREWTFTYKDEPSRSLKATVKEYKEEENYA